ncbi:TorD/DmsD family molecular chaperone [Noviherbaspirillum sp. ST9]|uniref:TorD/DmsD family molecular chaperone n=1 Tax=Noviherbaspirillum sp. ST9 TaxID=3401606 RepID=UPI003B588F1E
MSAYDPDEATAREDLCRFLAACFYEPGPEFAEEHLFDSMLAAATRVHPDLADGVRKLSAAFAAQDLQTLLVDYTRLFLGPVQAQANPYGSSWLAAPAQTEENPSLDVLELYSAGGFDISDEFMDLPDHVAVELEFLYLLEFQRNEAQRAGQMADLADVQQLKQKFLRAHLGAWIGPFAAAIKDGAETVFYRELADLTERFIRLQERDVGH